MEVRESKKAIFKQKVKVIQTRLESEKTEKIQTTWYCNHHNLISIKLICDTHACRSDIKPRLFGRNADPNYKQYAGISLAPRAADKAVRNALIAKSDKEIDNNPTLSDTEKAKEKKVYPTHPSNEDIAKYLLLQRAENKILYEFDKQINAFSRSDNYGVNCST